MFLSAPRSTHFCPPISRIAGPLLATLLLASCSGGPALAGDVASGPAPGEAVEIEAGDNFFKPDATTLEAGTEAIVEVRNTGGRPHDWTVDALDLSTGVIPPGGVFHARFTVPETGVEFVCTLHSGMNGTIRVN